MKPEIFHKCPNVLQMWAHLQGRLWNITFEEVMTVLWIMCFLWEKQLWYMVPDRIILKSLSNSIFLNMGSISRNSHDTLWLWLSVKFPVLDHFQQTKTNSSQKRAWWLLSPFGISSQVSSPERCRGRGPRSGVSGSQKFQCSKKGTVSIPRNLCVFSWYCKLKFVSFFQLRNASWITGVIG